MIVVIYGTIGEYTKVLPLIKRLGSSQCISINVNMQPKQTGELFATGDVPPPTISVLNGFRGDDINTIPRMAVWFFGFIFQLFRLRKTIRAAAKKEPSFFIVHGDTIIAPIAGFFAKHLYRMPVGHIEAGYRSGNWRDPFPEELDRILIDKIADVNYAVGEDTIVNLRSPKTKGRIVDTKENTIVDALLLAKAAKLQPKNLKLPKKYMLVSIHRAELITVEQKMRELIEAISANKSTPIVWLDHAPTQAKITQFGLNELLAKPHITRVPKLPYFPFIGLVTGSSAILTDSGGLQEEAYLLQIPTLIHRTFGEKQKAHMGTLSKLQKKILLDFLKNYKNYPNKSTQPKDSPVDIIIDDLKAHGYLSKKFA